MKATRILPRGIPDGSQPEKQNVRRATVRGSSEYSYKIAYRSHQPIKDSSAIVWLTILRNPGITARGISKKTGFGEGKVRSALNSLDNYNLLVYEDDYARLFPFSPESP